MTTFLVENLFSINYMKKAISILDVLYTWNAELSNRNVRYAKRYVLQRQLSPGYIQYHLNGCQYVLNYLCMTDTYCDALS